MRAWSMGMMMLVLACSGGQEPVEEPEEVVHPPEQEAWDTGPVHEHSAGLTVVHGGTALGAGDVVDLGEAAVGSTVPIETVLVVTNASDAALSLEGEVTGAGFDWVEGPPESLAAGESVPLRIGFVPPGDGESEGQLRLADLELRLQGVGLPPPPFIGWGGNRIFRSTDFGETWEIVELDPALSVFGVATNGERLVAAGADGSWSTGFVLFSDDGGLTWEEAFEPSRGAVLDVVYSAGRFILVGGAGNLAWSETGAYFFEEYRDYGDHLRAAAAGDGRVVAVGDSRRGVTTDGVSWDALEPASSALRSGVIYGGGYFVGLGNGVVATSADGGLTWTEMTVADTSLSGAYGGGQFVIAGWPDGTFTSTDGQSWTSVSESVEAPMCYGAGWFIAGGWRQRILRSTDGATWTEVRANDSDTSLPGMYGCIHAEAP